MCSEFLNMNHALDNLANKYLRRVNLFLTYDMILYAMLHTHTLPPRGIIFY